MGISADFIYSIQKLNNEKLKLLPGGIKTGERIASVCLERYRFFVTQNDEILLIVYFYFDRDLT